MKQKNSRAKNELAGVTHAFSVHPQWAYLIMYGNRKHGKKDVENRSRPTNFRERVAVHACQALTHKDKEWANQHNIPIEKLQPGRVIGTIEIYGCVKTSKSYWAEKGSYHWLLRNPKSLKKATKMKGSQNVFPIKGRLL